MNQTHHHSIHIPSESDLEAGVLHFQFYPSSSSYSSIPRRPLAVFFSFSDEPANGPHFLDSCHLCLKPLGSGRDIFMYRGDTPFCSEECRNEQIEMDEAEEKRLKKTKKMNQQRKSASPSKSEGLQLSAPGTVVAG